MIQRRTAKPVRSDKTQTFTYSLKLYTVDADSFRQAQEVADRLNAFAGTVFDFQTQQDYTVRFHVGVYAPPEPDILERAFGIDLHYKAGRRKLRPQRYREAAERWWLRFLRDPENTGNLFLGDHAPSEETRRTSARRRATPTPPTGRPSSSRAGTGSKRRDSRAQQARSRQP